MKEKLNNTFKIFTGQMKKRLIEKDNKGYTGWDKDVPCSELERRIATKLFAEVYSPKTYVDIANLAMFLFFRQNGTLRSKTNDYKRNDK